jgi:hypothetical protein
VSEIGFLYEKKKRWFGLEGVEAMPSSELYVIDFSASEPRSSCLEEVSLSCDEARGWCPWNEARADGERGTRGAGTSQDFKMDFISGGLG